MDVTQLTDWAALGAALGGFAQVGLLFGLWYAYKQYKASVDQSKLTLDLAKLGAKRDAICLAAEYCSYFGKEFTVSMTAFHKMLADGKSTFLRNCKVTISADSISVDSSKVTEADKAFLNSKSPEIFLILNELEGIAIPFAANVADDQIGYLECGHGFTATFEAIFPFYMKADPNSQMYKATRSVYWRWKKRIAAENHAKKVNDLKQQLTLTESQIDSDAMTSKEPFGA